MKNKLKTIRVDWKDYKKLLKLAKKDNQTLANTARRALANYFILRKV